ncbi:hypothetical protein RvY_14065 [Ramazzottius varieornatus]|uniref:Uncharacterized protein n=1 Tax=Ramazzottius varieornatus TaxID=947166 RepID=A0A1D1VTZ3_RAMVA|nr:hypothetical protein RvY_14065 [Ramazzottius varieornatus]
MKKKELNDHTEMRLEDFMKKINTGTSLENFRLTVTQIKLRVISKGQWHEAKTILIETYKCPGDETTSVSIYRIHYPG